MGFNSGFKGLMKYLNDPIGNQTRDLVACCAVPQPTSTPRLFTNFLINRIYKTHFTNFIYWTYLFNRTFGVKKRLLQNL